MSEQTMKLLRIYTNESAYIGDRRVFEYVAASARDSGLAGVTVLEALLGFGHSTQIRRRHVLENDRAVVIEIADTDAKLRAFATSLEQVTDIGLMTLEAIEIVGGKSRRQLS